MNKRMLLAGAISFTILLALIGLELYTGEGLPLPYRILVSVVIGALGYAIVLALKVKD